MKLSDRQAILLVAVLRDTLTYDVILPGGGQVSYDVRVKLYNGILDQQDDELIDLSTEPPGHPDHYKHCTCNICKEYRKKELS